MLNREAILAAQDLKTEDVDVPEWGGAVRVRMMSGLERDALGASLVGPDGKVSAERYKYKVLVRSLAADDGSRLFRDDEIEALAAKNPSVLERLYQVADRLNGMSESAVGAAEKNS